MIIESVVEPDEIEGPFFGSVTVANVTANTLGTVSVTIADQPVKEKLFCWTWGGAQATVQLYNISGSTYNFQYNYGMTTTNRIIFWMYYL
ncbi:MAG: hypothetical protein K8E24_013570 [Methanobacterium paludis]|nr:hypothetical protein [Methanobacterium paludis]